MKDSFNREISYMRISITDLCNLRCTYCMEDEGTPPVCQSGGKNELSLEELKEISEAAASCGIKKIRITGGEPLIRPDVIEICENIYNIPGIEEVTITTNGILLEKYARELKRAGVSRVNISLDTMEAGKYQRITRKGQIEPVMRGIEAAKQAGLFPLKINVVLLKDFNEDEIKNFVNLTKNESVEIRFIELMPIGVSKKKEKQGFIDGSAVLKQVPQLRLTEESGVARLYSLPGGIGRVGIISPVSRHFCPSCNRIRLTCDGYLKPCLHSQEEIQVRFLHGNALRAAMEQAIRLKPMEHQALGEGSGKRTGRKMNQIGG